MTNIFTAWSQFYNFASNVAKLNPTAVNFSCHSRRAFKIQELVLAVNGLHQAYPIPYLNEKPHQ